MDVLQIENTGQIIDDNAIVLLKDTFSDTESYIKHMSALWVLRKLLADRLEIMNCNSLEYKQLYPLFDTINNIIGALYDAEKPHCQKFDKLRN